MGIEQRVEKVEVRVDAHQQVLSELGGELRQFRKDVNTRFAQIDGRFVQIEGRFVQIEGRLVQIDGRLLQVDTRFVHVDGRLAAIDQKIDTGLAGLRHDMNLQFRWLVGIVLTGMVTIAAAILAQ